MFVKFAPGLFKIVKHTNEMCSIDFDELNKTNFPTHTMFSNYFEKTWGEFYKNVDVKCCFQKHNIYVGTQVSITNLTNKHTSTLQ
jgi:hypothetical protein